MRNELQKKSGVPIFHLQNPYTMLKKLIAGTGFLVLTAVPLAAQTTGAQKVERTNPINDYTPENRRYQKDHTPIDHTGISKDPQYRHATTAAEEEAKRREQAAELPPAADSTATPAPAGKEKPQR